MATWTASGTFIQGGAGVNGAAVDAWKASRFTGVPAYNAAPPAGVADASGVTTSASFGAQGAFQIALPTSEPYYLRVQSGGVSYWQLYNPIVWTDGSNGTFAFGSAGGGVGPSISTDSASIFIECSAGSAIYLRTNGQNQQGAFLINASGLARTHDGSGNPRNTLDDGAGNMTVAGNITVASDLNFSNASNFRRVESNADGSLRLFNSTGANSAPWVSVWRSDGTPFEALRVTVATGQTQAAGQVYPGAEASGLQSTGGLLHSTGIPSNTNGNNNDWCISDNGHLYFKSAGAWVQKV